MTAIEDPKIEAALQTLAVACPSMPGDLIEKQWDSVTATRMITVGATEKSTAAQWRRRIDFLWDSRVLTSFMQNVIDVGAASPSFVAAVRDVIAATTVRLPEVGAPVDVQAILTARDAFLSENDIAAFTATAFPRVCCIVGKTVRDINGALVGEVIGGTGFLVGPDVILTNAHVIEPLLDDGGQARPGTDADFAMFFDHDGERSIVDHQRDEPGTYRVQPHAAWRVELSPRARDGTPLERSLDYALVRLASRVGRAACNRRAGKRRGWFDIAVEPPAIDSDARLAIPQHPLGFGIKLDVGRAIGPLARSPTTRLRYSVNTTEGSSGSPVLARGGKLVCLHEGNKPKGAGDLAANQGIFVRAFNAALRPYVAAEQQSLLTSLWSVGAAHEELRPLLGRATLIDWIRAARVGSAVPPIRIVTGGPHSGKTFSIDILRAVLAREPDPVLVFRAAAKGGGGAYELPARPEELLRTLAGALGLDPTTIPPPPPEVVVLAREGGGVVADHKPNDWASRDLPGWLDKVLQAKPPAHRAWIVFDFGDTVPGPLMMDFIAGWTAPGKPDFAIFRWMFLGYDPVFRLLDASREPLNPLEDITMREIENFAAGAFRSAGFDDAPRYAVAFLQCALDNAVRAEHAEPGKFWSVAMPFLTVPLHGAVLDGSA